MKKSKMFGAIALSAVMAMGAVPAFAAVSPTDQLQNGTQNDQKPDDASDNVKGEFVYDSSVSGSTAATDVNVFYNADQIQATIPIEVTIVATGSPDKAGEIIAPTNYRIENNSTTKALQVKSVAAAANASSQDSKNKKWALASTASANTDANTGNLELTLQPSSYTSESSTAYKLSLTGIASGSTAMASDDGWKIAAKGTAGSSVDNENQYDSEVGEALAGILNFDLTGLSLPPQGIDQKSEVDKAFTITYTVGIAS